MFFAFKTFAYHVILILVCNFYCKVAFASAMKLDRIDIINIYMI